MAVASLRTVTAIFCRVIMNNKQPPSQADLRSSALYYHREPSQGKIAVVPTKQLTNLYDLALAYSPRVAAGVK